MKVLVLNSGSSSIKYALYAAGSLVELRAGFVERIGGEGHRATLSHGDRTTIFRI